MAIYYLDADDEITAAAQRIRDASDNRIALVVQTGSRIATSRINFRLLAREAKHRGRRLAIVASDPAVRALVETAGLPAFATVGDYQKAEAARPSLAGGSAAADATADALGELAASMDASGPSESRPALGRGEGPTRMVRTGRTGGRRRPVSNALLAVACVAALAGGLVGGYVLLPGATVVLTLREEALGPLTFNALVDPALGVANAGAGAVPGKPTTFPVAATDVFPATGENVAETAATGKVTFTSANTIQDIPVVAGTRVSTAKGIAFTTNSTVSVPHATVSGTSIKYGTVDVAVTAAVKGLSGNVGAGSIVNLPADLRSLLVGSNPVKPVTNRGATTGGTRTVTLFVSQADVDGAEAELGNRLEEAFQARLSAPDVTSTANALFTPGAHLGKASFSPDPSALVGKTQNEFELTANATGTALSAGNADLLELASTRLATMARPGYAPVPGSVTLVLGKATPDGDAVRVSVVARALQAPKLDEGELKAAIKGMTAEEAEAYLSRYGQARVTVGPFWASTVPGLDFRIDLQLVTPLASPTIVASPKPTVRHTSTPVRTRIPSATPPAPSPTPAATPLPSDTPSPVPADTPTASP